MPKVCFINAQGKQTELIAEPGASVMQTAMSNGLMGILGDCGGACQCATCHVYVEAPWARLFTPIDSSEDAMLDCTAEARQPGSRLSCCLTLSDGLDGLVVNLPRTQI